MHFQDENQKREIIIKDRKDERINDFLLKERTNCNIKNAIFTVSLKSNLI